MQMFTISELSLATPKTLQGMRKSQSAAKFTAVIAIDRNIEAL